MILGEIMKKMGKACFFK